MLTVALLAIVGLVWVGSGLAMIAAPTAWVGLIRRWFAERVPRFLLSQVAICAGLILILGTSAHQIAWLWMSLGILAVLKGMFILGANERLCHRLLEQWETTPPWAFRISGVLTVGLATLLTIDTIRIAS